ncbi:MAG: DNA alkylation repair protein, partial [Anaerolineales bacterium]
MNHILTQVRQELIHSADEKTKQNGPKFFKEEVKLYGVKTAIVTSISKKSFETIKEKDKGVILNLCEGLWKSGYLEEAFIACKWSYYIHNKYEQADLEVFKDWLQRYVSNWAACDTLCN